MLDAPWCIETKRPGFRTTPTASCVVHLPAASALSGPLSTPRTFAAPVQLAGAVTTQWSHGRETNPSSGSEVLTLLRRLARSGTLPGGHAADLHARHAEDLRLAGELPAGRPREVRAGRPRERSRTLAEGGAGDRPW